MPKMRIHQLATALGVDTDRVIDTLETLGYEGGRHINSSITEEVQAAVREAIADVPARPNPNPEINPDAAPTAMRIVDFAEEIGAEVYEVCDALEERGEKHHHASNIQPAAQAELREEFAQLEREAQAGDPLPEPPAGFYGPDAVPLEPSQGDEQVLELDPSSPVQGEILEFGTEPAVEPEYTTVVTGDVQTEFTEGADAVIEFVDTHGEFTPLPEVVPASDRFELVNGSGHPTGEFELLHPDLAAAVRKKLNGRGLMGFCLEVSRNMAVFTTFPDGQKYEVPA